MDKKRALVAVVNYKGKILIGKKRSDSPKFLAGKWHIPGETSEGNESDEEVLIRGVKEEVGIDIEVVRYLASHTTPTSKREARWYECHAKTGNITVGSDLENAMFVNPEDVLRICAERVYSKWPKEIIEYFNKKS